MEFFYNIGNRTINLFSGMKLENLKFQPMCFIENLGYMVKGMLGIFVVIGAIVILTIFLNKTANKLTK